jgi:hypothetical protein
MSAFLYVLLPLTLGAGEKEARAAVEKAIKAHGGAEAMAKAARCTRTETGTLDVAGKQVPFVRQVTRDLPKRVRAQTEVNSRVKTLLVMNGVEAYQTEGGPPALLLPWRLKEVQERAHVHWAVTLAPLLKPEFKLAALPDTKTEAGVVASHKEAPDVKLYFSKATGLLTRATWTGLEAGGKVEKELAFGDHKEFGGAKLPTKETLKHGGELRTTYTVSGYTFPATMEAKLFGKP